MEFTRITVEEACQRLAPLVGNPKTDTSDGKAGIADLIGNGAAFMVSHGGEDLVVIALEKVDRNDGKELIVTGALQVKRGGDYTEQILPEIEKRFGYDCTSMLIRTRRSGLIEKLKKQGHRNAATIMRKTI